MTLPPLRLAALLLLPLLPGAARSAEPESGWKKPVDNRIRAQALVDSVTAGGDEFVIVALHARPPGSQHFQIVASNLALIGKPDDAGDLLVDVDGRTAIVPILNESRISIMLPLLDSRGATIGALALASRYRGGEDQTKLFVRAAAIRDGLRAQIPAASALFEPAH